MQTLTTLLPSIILIAFSAQALALPKVHRGPSCPHVSKGHSATPSSARPVAARGMDPERATEIQNALIKSGYLTGSPTGVWDSDSQKAMQKLQSDNGWQTKLTPDSRAIIKLGLGSNSSSNAPSNAAVPESLADTPDVGSGSHVDLHSTSSSND